MKLIGYDSDSCVHCAIKYKGTPERRKKQRIKNRKRRLSKARRQNIYDRDGNKCVKCGSEESLTIDHIIPIRKGGKSNDSNLQTLCFNCNQDKG